MLFSEDEETRHKRNIEILFDKYAGKVDKTEILRIYEEVKEGYKDAQVRKHVPVFTLKEVRSALDKKLKPE